MMMMVVVVVVVVVVVMGGRNCVSFLEKNFESFVKISRHIFIKSHIECHKNRKYKNMTKIH